MSRDRLIRNVVLMGLAGIVIFGVVTLINMFGKKPDMGSENNFSPTRKMADISVKRKDWSSAVTHNTRLIEEDPHNSHAWFNMGSSHYQLARSAYIQKRDLENKNGEQTAIDELEEEFEKSSQDAIETFNVCLDYSRYKNRSLAYLALIYMLRGEKDQALDNLEAAVEDGYFNKESSLRGFASLRNDERFRVIQSKEARNRDLAYKKVRPEMFNASGSGK